MNQLEAIITKALAEVGYLEKRSDAQLDDKTANAGTGNYTKYWRDICPAFQGQAWCACFVSWCARKSGIDESVIPNFYSCTVGTNWFKTRSRYRLSPERGDLIFFGSGSSPQHVGIVTDVRGGQVYTVEGNTSGGSTMIANGGSVAAKVYDLKYNKILGYGRPNYIMEDDELTQEQFNKMMDTYLAERGKLAVNQNIVPKEYAEAVKAGITDGSRPQSFATRQESAVMVYRAFLKSSER